MEEAPSLGGGEPKAGGGFIHMLIINPDQTTLFIDKPKGPTSFDIIRFLRRELGIRKMGHAGTLDPLASGLMIIGINTGTKKLDEYLKLPKTYEADVLLGRSTTTGDLEGEVLEEKSPAGIDESSIERALASMIGELSLAVPIYSAIKVEGKPLYWYARQGIAPPEIPIKVMVIQEVRLLRTYTDELGYHAVVHFDVTSGTYIRILAEELGRRLNVPATLAGLRRTTIGAFDVADAIRLEYKNGILEMFNR